MIFFKYTTRGSINFHRLLYTVATGVWRLDNMNHDNCRNGDSECFASIFRLLNYMPMPLLISRKDDRPGSERPKSVSRPSSSLQV